jgi:AraC family transcriptional regulator of adaptative response / methylphosphotriester-DNA alkyltransferase methyltransferase
MNDEIWRAIVECDPIYDGQVCYALRTTGIYCKPSCKSRTPNRENVKIYLDPDTPARDGYRPCKRCRPQEPTSKTFDEELALKVTDLIDEHYQQPLSLSDMAARLYVSPFYLQKMFKKHLSISPSRYLLTRRLKAAKGLLTATGESITRIAQMSGFPNSAYFSAVFHKEVGQSPSVYRQMAHALQQNDTIPR